MLDLVGTSRWYLQGLDRSVDCSSKCSEDKDSLNTGQRVRPRIQVKKVPPRRDDPGGAEVCEISRTQFNPSF